MDLLFEMNMILTERKTSSTKSREEMLIYGTNGQVMQIQGRMQW